MPPKVKSAEKSKKSGRKNGGQKATVANVNSRVLRKDPKKKQFSDELETPSTSVKKGAPKGRPKKQAGGKEKTSKRTSEMEYELELEPGEAEDNFTDVSEEADAGENSSSNAQPTINEEKDDNIQPASNSGAMGGNDIADSIDKHVDAALDRYFRKQRSRKKRQKKRRRRNESSSDSEDTDSSSRDSDETTDESYSDSSGDEKRRSRKRKREVKKRKERKHKKGKSFSKANGSDSVSTIYTRGCKSPENVIMEGSSDGSLDGGRIRSDADTEEFISSLNTSRDHSTPDLAKRRSRSPQGRVGHKGGDAGRGHGREERREDEDHYRERADTVIRELHQNKADLVKPSGEASDFLLTSLLRDFKHFHLTSHVDKKIRERILDQDFMIDFR